MGKLRQGAGSRSLWVCHVTIVKHTPIWRNIPSGIDGARGAIITGVRIMVSFSCGTVLRADESATVIGGRWSCAGAPSG